MNVSSVKTKDYENKRPCRRRQNEPNTNPILSAIALAKADQTQFCGKQTQNEPNFAGKQTQFKPNLSASLSIVALAKMEAFLPSIALAKEGAKADFKLFAMGGRTAKIMFFNRLAHYINLNIKKSLKPVDSCVQ